MLRPRSHAAISDIERGKTKLNIEELAEIALILQKPLSYFTESRAAPSVVYRRSELEDSHERRRDNDRAIEAFKNLARAKAREQRGPA